MHIIHYSVRLCLGHFRWKGGLPRKNNLFQRGKQWNFHFFMWNVKNETHWVFLIMLHISHFSRQSSLEKIKTTCAVVLRFKLGWVISKGRKYLIRCCFHTCCFLLSFSCKSTNQTVFVHIVHWFAKLIKGGVGWEASTLALTSGFRGRRTQYCLGYQASIQLPPPLTPHIHTCEPYCQMAVNNSTCQLSTHKQHINLGLNMFLERKQ